MTAKTPQCQECKKAPSLYQCPCCARRTCSLQCCKSHKDRTGCNGKRDRTKFQRLEQMDDTTVKSDFFFLENVLQTVSGGKRLLKEVGATRAGVPHCLVAPAAAAATEEVEDDDEQQGPAKRPRRGENNNLPPKLRRLVQLAKERDVTLLLMPPGMKRHKSNATHFQAKTGTIIWKVEFILGNSTVTSNKVSEESTILEEWKKHKTDGDVHFLLKKLPCPANKPQYVEVAKESTLKEALRNMTVIEHPTIHVVEPQDVQNYPRLIAEVESKLEST